MIELTVVASYPAASGLERDLVTFTLWRGYGCRTAAEAHAWILELLTAGDEVVEVLDDDGELWRFYRETVAGVLTG